MAMTECPMCKGDGVVRSDESEPAPPTDGPTHVVHHVTCPVHEDQIAEFEATIEELHGRVAGLNRLYDDEMGMRLDAERALSALVDAVRNECDPAQIGRLSKVMAAAEVQISDHIDRALAGPPEREEKP